MSNKIHRLSILDILSRIYSILGKKIPQKELAHILGTTAQNITNWKNRNTIPVQELLDFSEKFKINFDWLLTGIDKPIDHDYPLSIHVASNGHKDLLNGASDDYRGIPLYESGRLAAGSNGMAFDQQEEPSSIVVVYRPELQGCAHHNLAAMRVDGYSMEPTIAKGSIVVVDLSDKEHFDSRIYAVNTPGGGVDMVSVKRVQKFKGGFSLISDNPQHPTVVSELDWDRLCVGRVVWMWKDVRES
jgi:phage repressor protein C with HTH and peptisase S24 domain